MRTAVAIAWLTVTWAALWGSITPANIASGILAATVVVRLLPSSPNATTAWVVRPLAAVHFAGWFTGKLVQANLTVLRAVLTPGDHTRPGVVAVPLSACSPGIAALIANAISLTPGTLTLDLRGDPPVLYVHVLQLDDPADVRTEVARLEVFVRRAFGSGMTDDAPAEEARSWT